LPASLEKATYANDAGSVELKRVWTDPEFDASVHAFYYVRVYTPLRTPKEIAPEETVSTRRQLGTNCTSTYCFPIREVRTFIWDTNRRGMGDKKDVWQGTLALMVLKTLQTMGPLHGYGIARRIEQISGHMLSLNYGTLYPALLKLEQEGSITSEWGASENNRKAKFYRLTRAGRKQLEQETREWEATTSILARFLSPGEEQA